MMDRAGNDIDGRGAEVVSRARAWIGTRYEHQASCRGAGADCLGLLRGLWREMLGAEPEAVPAYTPDWSEPGHTEDLLMAAERNLVRVAVPDAQPGDIAMFRMTTDSVAKHVGVLARSDDGHPTLIHAYSGHGVVESPLTPAWSRRIVGVFRFPERTT